RQHAEVSRGGRRAAEAPLVAHRHALRSTTGPPPRRRALLPRAGAGRRAARRARARCRREPRLRPSRLRAPERAPDLAPYVAPIRRSRPSIRCITKRSAGPNDPCTSRSTTRYVRRLFWSRFLTLRTTV